MLGTILASIISSALILSTPLTSPQSATDSYIFTRVLPQENYVSYIVEENDSFSRIALERYGDRDFWKNIWKDNPHVEDPNLLEKGTFLKISVEKPEKKEEIKKDVEKSEPVKTAKADYEAQSTTVPSTPVPTAVPTVVPPTVQPTAVSMPESPQVLNDAQITYLGTCEAGMDPTRNTGNGYYGAFQFAYSTWKSMGTGYERADLAPLEVQIDAVQRLLSRSSIYTQFPACARQMASAGLL